MSWNQKKNPKHIHDRLFFHDLINLTHGLILFLTDKKNAHKGIDPSEINSLEKEIRTLQMLIKDHYQFKHKNLDEGHDWLPFFEIKPALTGLIETYLSAKNIQCAVNTRGDEHDTLIYFPVFYRIMNNLIKNMAEAGSLHAEINLWFEESLVIETKNRVTKNNPEKEARSLEGLGLESIRLLTLESGGSFAHEISNQMWINNISLPVKRAEKVKRSAA